MLKEVMFDKKILDELREISEKKGRSLEDTMNMYASAFAGDGQETDFSVDADVFETDTGDFDTDTDVSITDKRIFDTDEVVYAIDYCGEFTLEGIKEGTWEDLRKEAAETGESLEAIAQYFVDEMNRQLSETRIEPVFLEAWRYLDSLEANKQQEEYKKVV